MSDPVDRLATALADRYAIERELGSGGMATVYQAQDLKHDRKVALKVMRPELSAILGGQRFLREIRIAAKLNHPHILALYDSGEADGFLYYVMPHVEGESLRAKVEREKQLSIDEAVLLTRQVASALDYAHQQGVIHRDIKPENILLHRGEAVVADFGIALAVTAAGGKRLTETGLSLGTPEYMSPEQATGDRDVDARSDIYSLGAVLYELLTGEPPQTGATVQAVIAKLLSQPPMPPRLVRDRVPEAMDRAIMKALAKVPADRFGSAAEFAAALTADAVAGSDEKSIAVLPFANLSPDPEMEYFSDGMTEEIINALTQLRDLRVAARTSSFAFKGTSPELAVVGAKLKVATVLEGSVRKVGTRLRVTAQLVKVADGYHLWSERYDRELEDVFAIQDEIAGAIADKLQVELLGEEKEGLVKPQTENLEAYSLYLKGRSYFLEFTLPECQLAIASYQQAINLDPDYAKAYEGLARVYTMVGGCGPLHLLAPREAYPLAKAALTKALELNDRLPQAHTTLGLVRSGFEWDSAGAERAFKRALELNPNDPDSHLWYAWYLWFFTHRFDEASSCLRTASALDPLYPLYQSAIGLVHLCARRYSEAVGQLQRVLETHPDFYHALMHLGDTYVALGMYEEAEAAYQKTEAIIGREPWLCVGLCDLYYAWDNLEEAKKYQEELLALSERRYVPPALIGYTYAALRDYDEAFEWLEKAYEERDPEARMFHWPVLDPLRSDPRFQALKSKMGLE